ncbi:MAG: hypothetical protein C5B59_17725 [Bacteroidetes bacterium]|nr:MAG: hypothetical protein C5B59_17725 [Bacteroidota bacterium]
MFFCKQTIDNLLINKKNMKYSTPIGLVAAIALIVACFMPWAYYPDIDKTFTGFFSQNNQYGRPGRFFVVLAIIYIVLLFIQKIWAKRLNQFIGILIFAYSIKTYYTFVACYRGICPEKKFGLILVMMAAIVMLAAAVVPYLKLKSKN